MKKFETDQEKFWAGEFGNEYIQRNSNETAVKNNIGMFSRVFGSTRDVSTVIEFGANIGLNLRAIKSLLPAVDLSAIEINEQAIQELSNWKEGSVNIFNQSILEFVPARSWDFVLIKTVLIHINPDYLDKVYDKLYHSCNRYICIAEYYNPKPLEVEYRGHQQRLYKRDFAGEMMDRFNNLKLVDYSFVYHRDNKNPQDDITWFLLEKYIE